jgi:hypothetical protein
MRDRRPQTKRLLSLRYPVDIEEPLVTGPLLLQGPICGIIAPYDSGSEKYFNL